jgi:hypothetical protein
MSGTRAISIKSKSELSPGFFLQGKSPEEIHVILTKKISLFLPGRAKNVSTPL